MYDNFMNDTHPSSASIHLETAAADLALAIGHLLRRLRQELNTGNLSWSQTSALARLDKAGPMTTAELARAESVKPQSMGATLADLEQEGLIERKPHPTDGRQVLLSLTAKGKEMRLKRNIAKQQWLVAAMEKLSTKEQQNLVSTIALLKRLGDI